MTPKQLDPHFPPGMQSKMRECVRMVILDGMSGYAVGKAQDVSRQAVCAEGMK